MQTNEGFEFPSCGFIFTLALTTITAIPAFAFRNGQIDTQTTAVVAYETKKSALCSGTAVTPTVMLTAAHCLGDFQTGTVSITRGTNGFGERSIGVVVPSGNHSPDSVSQEKDLAIVIFRDNTFRHYVALDDSWLSRGESVKAIAWDTRRLERYSGMNTLFVHNHDASKTKRIGYIINDQKGGAMPDLKGESGSPLFSDRGVAGVLRGCGDGTITVTDTTGRVQTTHVHGCGYVSLASEESLAALKRARERYPEQMKRVASRGTTAGPSPAPPARGPSIAPPPLPPQPQPAQVVPAPVRPAPAPSHPSIPFEEEDVGKTSEGLHRPKPGARSGRETVPTPAPEAQPRVPSQSAPGRELPSPPSPSIDFLEEEVGKTSEGLKKAPRKESP